MPPQNKTEIVITALNQTQQAFREVKGQLSGLNGDVTAFKGKITGFAASFSTLFASLGAATAVVAVVKGFRSIIDELDDVSKAAQQAGMNVEELTKLKFAGTVSDASVEQITKLSGQLSAVILKAKEGDKELSGLFKALNVDISGNRRTFDILKDTTAILSKMEDGWAKTALAKKLFGKAGAELIPFLNSLNVELGKVNVTISTETAQSAEEFNDNITRMQNNARSFGYSLAKDVLPFLVEVTNKLEKISRTDAFKGGAKLGLTALFPEAGIIIEMFNRRRQKPVPGGGVAADATSGALPDPSKSAGNPKLDAYLAELKKEQDKKDAAAAASKTLAEAKRVAAEAKRTAEQLAKALEGIDDTIAKNTLDKFEIEYREMNKRAAEYKKAGVRQIDIDRFVASETLRIQKEQAEETAKYRTEQMQDYAAKMAEALKKEQQLHEAEIQHQLSLVDTAEAYHLISKASASDQRLQLNKDLLAVQEKSLLTINKAADPSGYIAQANAIEDTRRKVLSFELAVRELSDDFGGGFAEGIRRMIQEADSLFQQGEQLAHGFADSLRGAFDDGFFSLMTGRFEDLRGVLQSFFQDLARQITNILSQRTTNSIISGIGSLLGGGGGGVDYSWVMNANGNAYASPSLSGYSGQVVSKPTMFKFAYGGVGVMGEGADAEGIFPLARDRSGKLGVRALGGGNTGNVTSNVVVNVDASGNATRSQSSSGMTPEMATSLGRMIDGAVMDVLIKQKRAGGLLA